MRISELARATGTSTHALRHYESLGLLAPARTAGGYRDYPESVRREVVFITMSRAIGFSLKDIATRLPAYRAGRLSFDAMVDAMHERIAAIDAEIDRLAAQRTQVADHIQWLQAQKAAHQARRSAQPSRKPWPSPGRKDTR